ncbi:MAG: GH3 auxin-responsive promoter family protein [Opitutae bacterium]
MTLAPRFLVNLWAGLRVARFSRRLRALGRGGAAQQATFTRLMTQLAGTEFGRAHGITAATTYAEYRERVPPRNYDYFAPLIARMAAGAEGVLSPGRCPFFVESAGTTDPVPKLLPVPESMLAHFRQGLRDALFLYATRAGHGGVFLGRHLQTGASTALTEEHGSYRTGVDGMLALCLTPWVEANLYAPPAAVARLPAGPAKTTAIVRAMQAQDVTLIAGPPANLGKLARAVREAAGGTQPRQTQLAEVWPNLECALFHGAPLGLHAEALREALGPTVKFHELYAAAEGIFAAQDNGSPAGLRLLTDTGVFFEFLPWAGYSPSRLATAGAVCLPLEKISAGLDYVLVVTTPAGLCRYVPGDIVRFMSVDPPRLQFVGRTVAQLNAFAEHVTERDLLETLLTVCARNGWQLVNFHVAPSSHRIAAGQTMNCHEWWMELHTHTARTPTANVIGPQLDAELARRDPKYAAKRQALDLDAPRVRLVPPGVFAQWAEAQQKSRSASQLPHCRSDRQIADQLAALTHFFDSSGVPFTPVNTRAPF